MKRITGADKAVKEITSGATVMVSGFMCCGQPFRLIDALLRKDVKNLTIISNDAGFPDRGIGKLVVAGKAGRFIASHIGLNPVAGQKMHSGEMEVILIPQGTLAEKIRCGGAGLGGVLTPTGLGTEIEKGKKIIAVEGKDYILETPLKADFALIKAAVCDRYGNAFIAKSAKNFNLVMAMAAEHVILETDRLVEPGELENEKVNLPGVFVDTIVPPENT